MKHSLLAWKHFRILATIALAALLTCSMALVGCGSSTDSQETTTIKIAYLPITHALPVLEEAQTLSESTDSSIQIELVQYGSWPELMDALNSGQVDGASVLAELAMRSVEQGNDLQAVALGHRDGNVIVGAQDLTSVADLEGKTIAIPARQSSHYILVLEALSQAGLSEDDVTITELAPTEMPSALATGTIQAYCVAEPFGAKGVEVGAGKVLKNSEELWEDSICCAFVLNGSFVQNNPEAAQTLVDAYNQAGEKLGESGEAQRVAQENLNQSEEVLETSLQWISYNNLVLDEDAYNELARRVKEAGLSENPPTYDQFVLNLDKE